ncbi:butyryl-CoA:acetate CoA-transferase [Pseudoramibacter faecis]|uniref:butyryl-CoA:acetate CoA-transferase n=1 Tax=Pseudoramibacter faecis TaxID=3108534 RepID=UPI002E76B454|nr:butyryl-CoA:acetate CoA-transferase [Pseudoramibacter sp. HA2172]
MSYLKEYADKLTTADEAVKVIKSGDYVDYGWVTCTVRALDEALAKRMPELTDVKIYGGIVPFRPKIFDVPDAKEHFTWNSWFYSGVDRKAVKDGFIFHGPVRYSEVPRYYRDMPHALNVAMFQVASMDKHGWFNFGPNTSHYREVVNKADVVIVEVNTSVPRCLGVEEAVHISEVDMIVEGDNPAMPESGGSTEPTEVDLAVAKQIVAEIPDGATLQLGIGGMPNTVGQLIAESDLKDLGVHTEMYVDSFVDLTRAGKITGARKPIDRYKQTYAFASGTKKLYDFLDDNPACMSAPVNYVNDPSVIGQFDDFMSINNAVDMDLFGQINAESAGLRQISGSGGQLDFVLGAYNSKGGKSFICMSSSFTDKKGVKHSRIKPTLTEGSIVTDTRSNSMYIVTEYGMAYLKGATTWERAEALIAIADPDFREELIADAEKMGIWRQSNKR